MELGVPCWSFGIEHLQGRLSFEGAAQIARALGFRNTAIGWSHLDWPKIRKDPVGAADDVRRVIEPLELEIDDSFIWFRNRYIDELVNELKCTLTQPDQDARDDNFEMLKSFTQFCVEIGCPGITLSSGIKYADQGFSFDEIYKVARDELRRMVDYAGERGVEIRPEPHSESIMGTRPDKVAHLGIARTFQNIELFPQMNVIDNLLTGRHIRMHGSVLDGALWLGKAKKEELENRRKVEDIIDFLEIEQWRKHPVALLPYGFQKRVELGRALAMEPKLLLLDEPVAGMNLEETEDMARFILDIKRELNIPMIMVEHDMGLVMDIADRVMVLDFGQRIAMGTPTEVQANPDVIAAYLGSEFA